MSYGVIEYNHLGQPKCEICNKYFNRVLNHVYQAHNMVALDYKITYGFERGKGICSKESSDKTRQKAKDNYEISGKRNLSLGKNSRFKKGHKGRTKDQVSYETKLKLIQHVKTNVPTEKRIELGRKLGKSGKGNLARWGKSVCE